MDMPMHWQNMSVVMKPVPNPMAFNMTALSVLMAASISRDWAMFFPGGFQCSINVSVIFSCSMMCDARLVDEQGLSNSKDITLVNIYQL